MLMTRKICTALLLSTLLLACSNKDIPPHTGNDGNTYIVMHKGLHLGGKLAPENSLDAINMAVRVGAKYVEIDVNITKDGEIVLMHDAFINNVCYNASDYTPIQGDSIDANTLTFDELRNNYVLIAKNPSMRRPVPTLEEALVLCKTKGVHPYIEIKADFFTKKDALKVYEIATRIMGKGNYSITSFSSSIIEYLRGLDSEVRLYQDMVEDTDYLKKYAVNYYSRYEPSWYSTPPKYEENISRMHQVGLSASTWTVPKEAFDTILVKGYDGILTDDVAPMFKLENAVFIDYSDNEFLSYTTDGLLADNIVYLNEGQTIELKELPVDSLYLGGLYFSVEAKGRFAISATSDFHIERENNSDDYSEYQFQYLFHKEKPYFEIRALEDSVRIKSIWLAVSDF